jgi:hypothetical protein
MVMELKLATAEQHKIADLLWVAESQEEVNSILRMFGQDARVVYELMTAAACDQVTDTELAKSVLDNFRI